MPYRVTKLITFSYGHRLLNYDGPCRNLHGHNGKIEIILERPGLDARGMVIDFSEIRQKIKKWVDDNWDHRLILNAKDPGLKELRKLDPAVVPIEANPTAENLARFLFEKTKKLGFPVKEIKIWETESSWASYSGEGDKG
ncbi:MAG: 6-carboxytetrahydropterin synthase [Elusimicrobia bacterium]|nr:6-carboxytetrahydropterin synthase [Elusimicrobiota bacterium]